MKFVGIVGSLRQRSYNRSVFNFYRGMAAATVEIVEGTIGDFPLYNDDVKDEGFPASVTALGDLIKSADGVIFFSPEYNYSVPAPLKNALDWLSRMQSQPLSGKPCAIVSASPGKLGGGRMQYHLRQIGVFLDIHFMNKPEAMISEVNKQVNEQGELTDQGTKDFLRKHLDAFVKFVQQTGPH